MIEQLKKNIIAELNMVREINRFYNSYNSASTEEKKLFEMSINSLIKRIKILNDSIPEILKSITLMKKLESNKENQNLINTILSTS